MYDLCSRCVCEMSICLDVMIPIHLFICCIGIDLECHLLKYRMVVKTTAKAD